MKNTWIYVFFLEKFKIRGGGRGPKKSKKIQKFKFQKVSNSRYKKNKKIDLFTLYTLFNDLKDIYVTAGLLDSTAVCLLAALEIVAFKRTTRSFPRSIVDGPAFPSRTERARCGTL